MTLTRIRLERFTAFERIDIELSPGINICIGENGTGKTHILKVAYAACDITKTKLAYPEKLIRVFLPFKRRLGRLVHRATKTTQATVEVYRGDLKLTCSFSNHAKRPEEARTTGYDNWVQRELESAYIPVKEMLANAPGFLSMYELRDVEFEEVYRDIILRAFRDMLRGPHDHARKRLLTILQGSKGIKGKVTRKEERFFFRDRHGELEFTLVAEGIRKLALLWLLIQNGTLVKGSVLFWDEPEANLNPLKIRTLIEILLELRRMGVQIVLATHEYVVLREFDLLSREEDDVRYHALYRDTDRVIRHTAARDLASIHPNAIADTFADMYRRDVERALGKDRK